jgi:hydrogenase-4 component E
VSRIVDPLLVVVLLLNFLMLGQSRLRAVIQCAGLQGILLGVLLIACHGTLDWRSLGLGVVSIGVKGLLIPALLLRAMRDAGIRREVEPLVSFVASLLLGAVGTAMAILFAGTLPLVEEHVHTLIVPASFATVLTGMLILTTRLKAITQVVGYLTLENGIFVFGLTLLEPMPFLVEIGVLLDLVVGVFVMGIVIDHINRAFSTVDTEHLTALRD